MQMHTPDKLALDARGAQRGRHEPEFFLIGLQMLEQFSKSTAPGHVESDHQTHHASQSDRIGREFLYLRANTLHVAALLHQ